MSSGVPGSGADNRSYRVVQWATGNIGARALRRVIEHPGLILAGVYVHSSGKAGRDAGDLAGGIGPVGIRATNNIDDIVALRPDCVLYMPYLCNIDEVCRLLESGINIVTTRGEFLNPNAMDQAVRGRVEQACHRGGASIHSTGSSPGFITEALPIVLASIQRRLNSLHINEFADVSSRDSAMMIFDIMGFGKTAGPVDHARQAHLRDAFAPSLQLTAEALGLPLEGFDVHGEVAVAKEDTKIAAGLISAGTVAAQRTTISGLRHGKPLISFTATWYCSTNVDTAGEAWNFLPSGWHIQLDGDAPLDVTIRFPTAPEHYAEMTPGLTAHRPVNAIPYVCAAPAGIRTTMDLPQIIAKLG